MSIVIIREEFGTKEIHRRDNKTLIYHHTIARTSKFQTVNPRAWTEALVASRKTEIDQHNKRLETDFQYELLNFIVETGREKNS